MGPAIHEVVGGQRGTHLRPAQRQGMAAAWPAAWPGRAGDPYAAKMNPITKYVASRTLTQDDLSW